jgi:hypothetical protein
VLSVFSVAIVYLVTFSIDHAVIFVEDLNEATADFERVGFQVTPGGTHAGGLTKNALIPLADGTYLELLAFNIPDTHRDLSHSEALKTIEGTTPMDHRFLPRGAEGEGFRDLALGTVGLREVVDNAGAAGLEIEGPFPGRRVRPDGREVSWELAFPKDSGLPFLIEDVTDRHLRVPSGDATRHPNGVTGIGEVVVHVDDFDGAVDGSYGVKPTRGKTPPCFTSTAATSRSAAANTPLFSTNSASAHPPPRPPVNSNATVFESRCADPSHQAFGPRNRLSKTP